MFTIYGITDTIYGKNRSWICARNGLYMYTVLITQIQNADWWNCFSKLLIFVTARIKNVPCKGPLYISVAEKCSCGYGICLLHKNQKPYLLAARWFWHCPQYKTSGFSATLNRGVKPFTRHVLGSSVVTNINNFIIYNVESATPLSRV